LVVALDFAARYNEKCAAFNSLIFIADSKNMTLNSFFNIQKSTTGVDESSLPAFCSSS
jgi:hypothetical protein